MVRGYRIFSSVDQTETRNHKKLSDESKGNNAIRSVEFPEVGCSRLRLSIQRWISEWYVYSEKEVWRKRPVIKLKGLNQYSSYLYFKIESLKPLKTFLTKKKEKKKTRKKRVHVQLDHNDAYLCVSFSLGDQKRIVFR